MTPNSDERAGEGRAPDASAIHDRRVKPRGVLPRHVQMWLMVGIAVVILGIILFTGHPEPLQRPQSGARSLQPSLVPPDRVRSYEQEIAAEQARQQAAVGQLAGPGRASKPAGVITPAAVDQLTDEQRRREYQSLFADNVALSRRPTDKQPYGGPRQQSLTTQPATAPLSPELAVLQQLIAQRQGGAPLRGIAPASSTTPPFVSSQAPIEAPTGAASDPDVRPTPRQTGPITAGVGPQRLLEGTLIETVLVNRLDGTFAGPVDCLVTTPVYSHDRQSVIVPAGARVLGAALPVQTWGDSRLAVAFHRLVMPDGRTFGLDRFKGLNQVGSTGLTDSVNRHYLQVFGASVAIGALSGLAQYGTGGGNNTYSFAQQYGQAAGSSLAASTGRVLDRYLNVLPTVTIREGYRIKVYLTNDLELPIYAPAAAGGVR